MPDEPFADYFLEEIDYLQSRIDNDIKKKAKIERRKEINYSHVDRPNKDNQIPQYHNRHKDNQISIDNVTHESSNRKNGWPSFEDILKEMGEKYDWKNDRWIKVKNKDKDKHKPVDSKNNVEHNIKHNFKYRIVKLNRAKSKRNIVVAVTAVRQKNKFVEVQTYYWGFYNFDINGDQSDKSC